MISTKLRSRCRLADYGNDDDVPSYMLDARNRSVNDSYYTPVAVNDEPSLSELLERQLSELTLTPRQLHIAGYVIGNLDSNGYLKRSAAAIADDMTFADSDETEPAEVAEVIDIIRTLDPAGVGASDLRDCLLLQAAAQAAYGRSAHRPRDNHPLLRSILKKTFRPSCRYARYRP